MADKQQQAKKTWAYDLDFKIKAVRLSHQDGIQVQQVAEALDIHPFMLSRWSKAYRDGELTGKRPSGARMKKKQTVSRTGVSELEALRSENARLQKENTLLKKWQRYLAERHQSDLDSSKRMDKN